MGWITAFAVLSFYPLKLVAEVVILRRYGRIAKNGASGVKSSAGKSFPFIDVPINEIEKAIDLARLNNTSHVRISFGLGEDQTRRPPPKP